MHPARSERMVLERRADLPSPETDYRQALAVGQGLYFAATGIWPIVHMSSFERVTGAKTDKWLVRTVGLLVTAIGVTLISAGLHRRVTAETAELAIGSSLGLGAIDTIYSAAGTISPIYLADAAIEAALISGWIASSNRDSGSSRHHSRSKEQS